MVPFVDLKAQHLSLKDDLEAAVGRVLEKGQFCLGEEVENFEAEFSEFCQARSAVAVNSGTSALHLALLAAGVGPGDEVITVPMTFVATVAAIRYTGARPVLVDIDPRTYTMDASRLEEAITPATKAVIPVHLYGHVADMDPIFDIARHHALTVIEDAAQAHGAEYKGRRSGSLSDFGCFSFYPTKNLGACGEGGIVTVNDPDHDKTLRMLRNWGQADRNNHVLRGFNYRMDGIQGAVLRVKLRKLQEWNEARREHAAQYDRLLVDTGVVTPPAMPYAHHVYHLYAIRAADRDVLQQTLLENQIQTQIHYPVPVHLMKAHQDLGYRSGAFPHAERLGREELSLPIYPELGQEVPEKVAVCIRSCEPRMVPRATAADA